MSDLLAADKIHATSILVLSGHGAETESLLGPGVVEPAAVLRDLGEATDWILEHRSVVTS